MTFEVLERMTLRRINRSILLLPILWSVPARADEATKQRFLREYPAASKTWCDRFENARCRVRIHQESDPDSQYVESRFCRSHGYDKVETTRFGELANSRDKRFDVIVRRDDPRFYLRRNSADEPFEPWQSASNPYELRNLRKKLLHPKGVRAGLKLLETESAVSSMTVNAKINFSVDCGQWIYGPLGGDIGQVETWMSDPGFVLIDAEPLAETPEIVEVRFEIQSGNRPLSHIVRLDTSNFWALTFHRFEIKGSKLPPRTWEFRYGPRHDGFAWPLSAVSRSRPAEVTLCEFSGWSFEPTPQAEFRMSHYGLKDPWIDWVDRKVQSLAVLAIAGSTLGGIRSVRRWRRKESAKAEIAVG